MKLIMRSLLLLSLLLFGVAVAEAQSIGSVTTASGKSWTTVLAPDINDDLTKIYATPFVTIGAQTGFSAERSLAAGTFLSLTDGGANGAATFAVNDAELLCLGGLTSAADKVPYFTGSGTCALSDFSSALRTFITTPSSANFRSWMNDEIGSGVLVFLGTPADDQVPVGDSASATTWRTLPDSDAATQKLQYDQSTNTFSVGTDDDIPDAADYTNLTGGSGITNSPTGTINFDGTELTTVTLGAGNFTDLILSGAGAIDITLNGATSNELSITQADAGAAGPQAVLFANSASPAASDIIGASLYRGKDSAANNQDYARANVTIDDATSTSEDATMRWAVVTAGTFANELDLRGDALFPDASDGLALGTSSLMFSDLFLASGAVVNFNNGNMTLTHSAGALTFAGGGVSIGTGNALTTGTIELGAVSDTTLSRVSAGVAAIEGVTIVTTATDDDVPDAADYTNLTGGVGIVNSPTGTVLFDFSDAGASPSLSADQARFTSNATVPGYLVFEGDTADGIETRIAITDPTASDKTFTIPNADSNAVQPLTCSGSDKVSAISAAGVITCTADSGAAGGDSISVNGSAATDADFDDATPAASGGGLNVKWQKDGGTPNNISAYVDINGLTEDTAPDQNADFLPTYDASATATKKVKLSRVGAGKQTLAFPAGSLTSRTTNGCAAGTAETSTNKIMIKSCDFDTTTQEFAQLIIPSMPKNWNEGTFTAKFEWTHAATVTNFGVVWALECASFSDNEGLDGTAFGTAQQIADTGGTTNQNYITSETPAITAGGSPAEGDSMVCQIKRVPADGSDTMAVDARLMGVDIIITTDANTDN